MEASDKRVPIFLVIGPDFTPESVTESIQYTAEHIDRRIVLVRAGDLASLGIRYADTTRYDRYSGYLNTRFPLNDQWRINPKLTVSFREHKYEDEDQWTLSPSLRLEYRLKRALRFEIEGGYEWTNETISGLDEETRGFFFTVGYRWDF